MSIIEKALNKAKDEGLPIDRATEFSIEAKNIKVEQSTDLNATANSSVKVSEKSEQEKLTNDGEVVEINWKQLAELGFVTPVDSNTQTIEEYRNIKRPLVSNAFGESSVGIERANLILVTSSVPGEGKTFTAINLALSIATERDKKVLLIDADVARPSVSKTLGIKSSPGLIEYLEGQDYKFSDIILKTNMPGLRIIPAGKQHKHSTELLSSNRMVVLARELSERYPDRIVIFDSPPLLAATQGEVLAGLVGQVVLVIEAESTSQSMVMESVSRLAHCDVVLAVLNKAKQNTMDGGYYGYGQYAH
ncbi:MAG: XrtA-associated tyrosine autokinase [Methylococcales bacterium]